MNKLILGLVGLCVAGSVMAQGTFTFKTKSGTTVDAKTTATDPTVLITGADGWKAQVLWSTSQNGIYSVATGTKVGTATEASIGASYASTPAAAVGYITAGGDWALKGAAEGSTVWLKIDAYLDPGNLGYSAAIAAGKLHGASDAFSVVLGAPTGSPPSTPTLLAGVKPWVVTVPEPSVIALGVLGVGAFLIRRRS